MYQLEVSSQQFRWGGKLWVQIGQWHKRLAKWHVCRKWSRAVAFSNNDLGVSFTVLTATNPSLPLSNWTVVGPATNPAPGLFQFSTDTTNNPQGYYRIRSP